MSVTMHADPTAAADRDRHAAREHARAGRAHDAEACFRRVLAERGDDVEALRFIAAQAAGRGEDGEAVALLSRAAKAAPEDAGVLAELGIVYRSAERYDAARYVLERAVALDAARNPSMRLVLADVLERDARPELALLHYFRALVDARRLRRWTGEDGAGYEIERLAAHAERYAAAGRRAWFERALAAEGMTCSERVRAALAMYLGERPVALADPRQRSVFLPVPGLAATPFLDRGQFPWLAAASATLATLGAEAAACLAAVPRQAALRLAIQLHGIAQYEARRHAPRLVAALASLPLPHIANHAPEAELLALDTGASLPAQYGRANWRPRAIVALAGSASFDVVAGGEQRTLVAGESVVADASFGIAYRASGAARALTFEVWHPDLAAHERQALSVLALAAVDFDTRLSEL
ncbi:MAG TPA: aspartyl/asparaginyl beta-hydroxylase domain-containing protein [Rudaea sp.]|nr:aspartyl/asparaginyl beta-hydroxylase domain-containing protein [Rudaea sp.]